MRIYGPPNSVLLAIETGWAKEDGIQTPFEPGERANWVESLIERMTAWLPTGDYLFKGEKGRCFENSLAAVLPTPKNPGRLIEGVYAEGMALDPKDEYYYHHAWVIAINTPGILDTVERAERAYEAYPYTLIELSWPKNGGVYFGVPFSEEEALKWRKKGPSRSLLWNSEVRYLVRRALEENLKDPNWPGELRYED